jgi:predicted GNAT superfamily acetyltransferase
MALDYRSISTHAEYLAAEDLQYAVWGGSEREIVPVPMLLTAHKNGGVLLGAFDDQRLVGLVFSFVGITTRRGLKHCSHLLAVDPAYRNQQVGRKLKLLQREAVLAQGISHITWTFDPLESRNALLNIHHLGTVCNTYLPNLYGAMVDALNAGLPSDRFQVDWYLTSTRVRQAIGQSPAASRYEQLHDREALVLNPAPLNDLQAPAQECRAPTGDRCMIRIPSAFQELKTARPELGMAWRMQFREVCMLAFAMGYLAVDAVRANEGTYYVLKRGSNQ